MQRVPPRDLRWRNEERLLLWNTLWPGALGTYLKALAGGDWAGQREGPPRRSLRFYARPNECKREKPFYPNATYRESQLITWVPRPVRFILAVCHYGQMNNQMMCMDNYFLFAALLNRTLVIPPGSMAKGAMFNWSWDLAVDRAHANRCLGPGAVLSLDELRARLGTPRVTVDNVSCIVVGRTFCNPAAWKLDGLNLTLPAGEPTKRQFEKPTRAEFLSLFAGDDSRVVTMEDLFVPQIPDISHRVYYPLRSRCGGQPYIRSHPAIRAAAEGLAQELLGKNFLAMHFRRGDFYKFWKPIKMWNCYWPEISAVSRALLAHGARRNISRVFVATNAHHREIELLQKLLDRKKPLSSMALVLLPRLDSLPAGGAPRPWAQAWLDMRLDDDPFAISILDKLICTKAAHFIGTGGSTFSDDIYKIRYAEGTATCEDNDFLHFEQEEIAHARGSKGAST